MKLYNDYSLVMSKVDGVSKLKDTNQEAEVQYDVFNGANVYVPIGLYKTCSKTAFDIIYFIGNNVKRNQTSIKFTVKDLIESFDVKSKTVSILYNALKELVDNGVIVRWRDIETIPNREHIPKSWYLINPLIIRNISCRKFKEQVEVTTRIIEANSNFIVNDYSAIVHVFTSNKQIKWKKNG